jgi:phosphoglycerate dehydrogenase-like enzyme
MTRREVLILPPRFHAQGPHWDMLRAAGFEVRLPVAGRSLAQACALAEAIGDAEAVIAGSEPFTRQVLEHARKLRVIVRSGVGFDNIDLAAADERRIVVATTPGVNHLSVAEHALAMLLALARGFPRRDREMRRGGPWKRAPVPRLAGRTLGIIGLGRIGKALADKVSGLGLKLLAYDPFPDREFAARHRIALVGFEELLGASDLVSLHLPLSEQTRGLVCRRTLGLMKPGAILVNTARGELVREEDLREALLEGRLAGAGLDVFAEEPLPPGHFLLEMDNVLLSPHVAGFDDVSYREAKAAIARITIDLAQGRWPEECVVNLRGVTDWKW